MKQQWRGNVLIVVAMVISLDAFAQRSEEDELAAAYGDKAVVSIATGSSQPITKAPSTATVITSKDIEAMGASTLAEVLESVPGLHMSVSSINYVPVYYFRGISQVYTPGALILVNGIKMNMPFQGWASFVFAPITVKNISRIEVIRGPGSALYGADAYSGVINIITRSGLDIESLEAGIRVGSYSTRDAWLQYGGKFGDVQAAFFLRYGDSNGQRGIIEKDFQSTLDDAFHTKTSATPGPVNVDYRALDATMDLVYRNWQLRMNYQKQKIGTGAGLGGNLDAAGKFPGDRRGADLTYHDTNSVPNWDLSAVFSLHDQREWVGDPPYHLFQPGALNGIFPDGIIGNPGHEEKRTSFKLAGAYSGISNHKIRIGLGYEKESLYKTEEYKNFKIVNDPVLGNVIVPLGSVIRTSVDDPGAIFITPHDRALKYMFVQDEWTVAKDWTLTAGIRRDQYSDFGSTTNPRIALVWDAAYNWIFKAIRGHAFRAPSFASQYSQNNPVNIGNASLKPETIITNELNASWLAKPNLQTSLTLFSYKQSGIIDVVPELGNTGLAQAQNAGTQTGKGLELEATWDVSRNLRLTGNYSLQHSIDEASKKDAGLAPHRRIYLRSDWRFAPSWQFGSIINHVADRARQPGDIRAKIADYTTVDLSLRREKVYDRWNIQFSVHNLFNAKAREPSRLADNIPFDLPLPGRQLDLEFQYFFK